MVNPIPAETARRAQLLAAVITFVSGALAAGISIWANVSDNRTLALAAVTGALIGVALIAASCGVIIARIPKEP